MFGHQQNAPEGLRIIKTARGQVAINEAAEEGWFPLVKKVEPSPELRNKYICFQHLKRGQVELIHDFRDMPPADYQLLFYGEYYPNPQEHYIAAYLLPKNLKKGEGVWLEEVIGDIVATSWNQGNTYRLESAAAVWNGRDFDIEAPEEPTIFIG